MTQSQRRHRLDIPSVRLLLLQLLLLAAPAVLVQPCSGAFLRAASKSHGGDVSSSSHRSGGADTDASRRTAAAARAADPGGARRALRQSAGSDVGVQAQPAGAAGTAAAAAIYMDSLLADPAAARSRLCGNFTQRSKVAVVYMCYERMEMIERALPAVLRSEGLEAMDVFISQDGGAGSIFNDEFAAPLGGAQFVYIRHPVNLCAGLHHYFVKAFAFELMEYDTLLVVEEDNVVHPQALQLLARMAELSVSAPTIGVVSLLDMDMSAFLDASRFAEGIIQTAGAMGHLWVFGLHRSKYEAVRGLLRDYYDVIKGHDYRRKHEPPLRDAIESLMRARGFPLPNELSQDRWFINSLAQAGFPRRYQTLFRFFEPIGHYGLHFRFNESAFYGIFGRHMFGGRIDPAAALDVTQDAAQRGAVRAAVHARLADLCARYWGGVPPPERLVNNTFNALMEGRLNGMEAVRDTMMKGPRKPPAPSSGR